MAEGPRVEKIGASMRSCIVRRALRGPDGKLRDKSKLEWAEDEAEERREIAIALYE
jgi:hypothetical protein